MFPARIMAVLGGDSFRDEYSLLFDGTNANIRIPEITMSVHDNNYSFVFWCKRAATGGTYTIIGDTSHSNAKSIRFSSSDKIRFEDNTDTFADITQNVNDTGWHHYVIIAGGGAGVVTAYQDGVICSVSGDVSGGDFTIDTLAGSGSGGKNYEFYGNISEIAIYNTALTSSQAKQIYNDREPFDHNNWSKVRNLIHWWRFGDANSDVLSVTESTTTDTTGFLQDVASDITYTDLVTGWTNTDYGTFVSSGVDVSSAISDGSASHEFRSNDIDITAGDIVEISFTIAGSLVPSSNLTFKLSDNVSLNNTQFDASITGAGDYHFFALWTTTESTSHVGIRASSEACNYSMTNFICKKVAGGKPGFIVNMNPGDFVGDTP